MKQTKRGLLVAMCLFGLVACKKELAPSSSETEGADLSSKAIQSGGNGAKARYGHVYTLSNQPGGNNVLAYSRAADGTLTYEAAYSTGGTGTGGGLGNQGALILTQDGGELLAVNPGSNTVSSFKINGSGLKLKSTVNSNGIRPVSVTQHGHLVFVLNAGGTGSISGFTLGENDKLTPIHNSTRLLSSTMAGAAQISFVNEGKVLAITEKATNKIITYTVNGSGIPGSMHSITSANQTPFGFAVGVNQKIYVSEAAGGAPGASTLSSYSINNNGAISLANGPVGAGQSAACWVVLTKNNLYAYTTNTASDNLSAFSVNASSGNLGLLQAIAATSGSGPIDAALDSNSDFLYVLNSGSHSISTFRVANNGNLSSVQTLPGVPAGATGLAAN
ncbi:MAG TPA: beta-propeller fold lactonase family protein [Flavisolibacter sp.]|jgi:6-phosphogluconolactonase (cycloisomerase 2 family)|nr:beta-propeller fold lactonase family protein [Flavisolibacter sp.]